MGELPVRPAAGERGKEQSRRDFIRLLLQAGIALPFISLLDACDSPYQVSYAHIKGEIKGAASGLAHMLREGKFPAPATTEEKDIVIAGGGIAALAAARRLAKAGEQEICLLELSEKTGGNSAWGENVVSRYPWGAHYLPLPELSLTELLDFLEEIKAITGYDAAGQPVYEELFLCNDPQERLYINHRWQEGLVPEFGIDEKELREIKRFMALVGALRLAKGADGKYAFALPVDASSADEKFTALDRISMENWLQQEKFSSPALHWYLNYCCRDDYGTAIGQTSAWAGLHYFACRRGTGANAAAGDVLTWPEGNGFLAEALRKQFRGEMRTQALVFNIEQYDDHVLVDYYDAEQKRSRRIKAKQCICALPQYVSAKVIRNMPARKEQAAAFSYSPWMVANITLEQLPDDKGIPLSWDNVIYESESLGYVNACQQHTDLRERKKVLTFYFPFSGADPKSERKRIYDKTHADWVKLVVDELEKAHPGISPLISTVDVWLWGHAMIRPQVGFIHGSARRVMRQPAGERLFFAHSDLGGISVFEEAFYQGNRAAEELIATRKRR